MNRKEDILMVSPSSVFSKYTNMVKLLPGLIEGFGGLSLMMMILLDIFRGVHIVKDVVKPWFYCLEQ